MTAYRFSHWLQRNAPHLPTELPLPLRRSSPPSNTPIPHATPRTTPNGIRIDPISRFVTVHPPDRQTDRQTEFNRPTDRQTDELGDRSVSRPAYVLRL